MSWTRASQSISKFKNAMMIVNISYEISKTSDKHEISCILTWYALDKPLSQNQLSNFWLLIIWRTWNLLECILTWYDWDNWGVRRLECIGLGAHASRTMVLVLFWSSVFVVTNETHTHLTQWVLISGHLSYLIWTWYAWDKSGVRRLECIGLGAHAYKKKYKFYIQFN